jgi:hypothetical protein
VKKEPVPTAPSPEAQQPSETYEPPRILAKRSVERTTLFQTTISPDHPPIGGH